MQTSVEVLEPPLRSSCRDHHYVELRTVYERAQTLLESTRNGEDLSAETTSETVGVLTQTFHLIQRVKSCSSSCTAGAVLQHHNSSRNDLSSTTQEQANFNRFQKLIADLRDALTEIVVVLVPSLLYGRRVREPSWRRSQV